MVTVTINIPEEYYNQLNNFYIDNFGYDIYTQLNNFLVHELDKCKGYSTDKPISLPKPTIRRAKDKFLFHVTYIDNTTTELKFDTYDECLKLWNEWSKYSFSMESKDIVLEKLCPERLKYISKNKGGYQIRRTINGQRVSYGWYSSIDDALCVRHFLISHKWDMKYTQSKLVERFDKCNVKNSSQYLLKIAKGELEL